VIEDYTQNVGGRFTLRILSAFRRQEGMANRQYKILLPGVRNPIQVTPTKPFIFRTFTNDDYGIDSFDGANIQMLTSAEIQNI
jgi:hypothetical protein